MHLIPRKSLAEGVAEHVRKGIDEGHWTSRLPGLRPLSVELGVSIKVVSKALVLLEREGLLSPSVQGESRRIITRVEPPRSDGVLRVAILLSRPFEAESPASQALLMRVVVAITGRGHHCVTVVHPSATALDRTDGLRRLIAETGAAAWIVWRGGVETLGWFASQNLRALAFAGRADAGSLPALFCDISEAIRLVVRQLVALGHRRIVMISPERSLTSVPALSVRAFREELRVAGIFSGEYNTPHWENTAEGLLRLMKSLFALTPPTALILMGNNYLSGVFFFLAGRGLRVPEDVSLVFADIAGGSFDWQWPGLELSYIDGRSDLMQKGLVRWVDRVAAGGDPVSPPRIKAKYMPGGSVASPCGSCLHEGNAGGGGALRFASLAREP